jgi:hypothetical protein
MWWPGCLEPNCRTFFQDDLYEQVISTYNAQRGLGVPHKIKALIAFLLLLLLPADSLAKESKPPPFKLGDSIEKNRVVKFPKERFIGDFEPPDYQPKPLVEVPGLSAEEQALQSKWKEKISEELRELVLKYWKTFGRASRASCRISFTVGRDKAISAIQTIGDSIVLNAISRACVTRYKENELLNFPKEFTVDRVDFSFDVPGVRRQVQIGDFDSTKCYK